VSEFIFMLTNRDRTVADALEVYEQVRDTALNHVGFKDIGATAEVLRTLCRRMHDDGRRVYLEVVSDSVDQELRSVAAARRIAVDVVMGGTHADEALTLLAGTGIEYFPFPGRVVGHPSELQGTVDEIEASALALAARPGVNGLDLLAYRHAGDVPSIVEAVVRASGLPVVVAGSIVSEDQIRTVTGLGAWAFTIGSAAFDGALPTGPSIRDQVEWAIEAALRASPPSAASAP
jgi:hypothetical protein